MTHNSPCADRFILEAYVAILAAPGEGPAHGFILMMSLRLPRSCNVGLGGEVERMQEGAIYAPLANSECGLPM
jgi:hypothetical protein